MKTVVMSSEVCRAVVRLLPDGGLETSLIVALTTARDFSTSLCFGRNDKNEEAFIEVLKAQ